MDFEISITPVGESGDHWLWSIKWAEGPEEHHGTQSMSGEVNGPREFAHETAERNATAVAKRLGAATPDPSTEPASYTFNPSTGERA